MRTDVFVRGHVQQLLERVATRPTHRHLMPCRLWQRVNVCSMLTGSFPCSRQLMPCRLWQSVSTSEDRAERRAAAGARTALSSRALRGHTEGVSCLRFLVDADGASHRPKMDVWQVATEVLNEGQAGGADLAFIELMNPRSRHGTVHVLPPAHSCDSMHALSKSEVERLAGPRKQQPSLQCPLPLMPRLKFHASCRRPRSHRKTRERQPRCDHPRVAAEPRLAVRARGAAGPRRRGQVPRTAHQRVPRCSSFNGSALTPCRRVHLCHSASKPSHLWALMMARRPGFRTWYRIESRCSFGLRDRACRNLRVHILQCVRKP